MGKFIVIACASLFCCGIVYHYAPSIVNHAFYLGSFDVRWMFLLLGGFVFCGYKLAGK